MQLHNLKSKTPRKKSRQVGRGGKRGKTAGRGTKGQNARAGRKKRPELRDFIKRFPKLRGRGKNSLKSIQPTLRGAELKEYLAQKKTLAHKPADETKRQTASAKIK